MVENHHHINKFAIKLLSNGESKTEIENEENEDDDAVKNDSSVKSNTSIVLIKNSSRKKRFNDIRSSSNITNTKNYIKKSYCWRENQPSKQ